MITSCNYKLLADAEVTEDIVEGVITADFTTGDFTNGGDGMP